MDKEFYIAHDDGFLKVKIEENTLSIELHNIDESNVFRLNRNDVIKMLSGLYEMSLNMTDNHADTKWSELL